MDRMKLLSLSLAVAAVAVSGSIAQAKPGNTPRTFESRDGKTHLFGDGGGMAPSGAGGTATAAITGSVDIDLSNFDDYGDFTNPLNTSVVVPVLPSVYITGVSWSGLNFDTENGSYQSEFVLSTNRSDNTGAAGTFWDYAPSTVDGTGSYSGSGSFTSPSPQYQSGPFQLGADGNLLVYVYDTFDDDFNSPTPELERDAHVTAGTLHVSYTDVAPPPPTAPASIPATSGGSIHTTLGAAEVQFYSFTWAGGAITLDTEGTTLAPDNDTEIAIFDAATGALVATDDDGGTDLLSSLSGTLAAGNYLLAVGAFNSTFASGFVATSTSALTGSLVINGIHVVAPEPTTLAALALGGIFIRRRRRA